jgi:hypothetical protein
MNPRFLSDRAIARLKATKPKPPLKNHSYDWANVDWSKTNGQIAKSLGCAWQTVRDQRKRRSQ